MLVAALTSCPIIGSVTLLMGIVFANVMTDSPNRAVRSSKSYSRPDEPSVFPGGMAVITKSAPRLVRASSLGIRHSLVIPPPVRIPHVNHHPQDVVPGLRLHHDVIREHAAVPAEVPEFLRRVAVGIAHPVAGVVGDFELAVGVVRQAMPS